MAYDGQPSKTTRDLLIMEGSPNEWAWRYGTKADAEAETVYQDFTGWGARAQIRGDYGQSVWFSATEADHITLMADGHIYFRIPVSETDGSAWWSAGRTAGVWDLELVPPEGQGEPFRFCEGKVLIDKNVTRPDGK